MAVMFYFQLYAVSNNQIKMLKSEFTSFIHFTHWRFWGRCP